MRLAGRGCIARLGFGVFVRPMGGSTSNDHDVRVGHRPHVIAWGRDFRRCLAACAGHRGGWRNVYQVRVRCRQSKIEITKLEHIWRIPLAKPNTSREEAKGGRQAWAPGRNATAAGRMCRGQPERSGKRTPQTARGNGARQKSSGDMNNYVSPWMDERRHQRNMKESLSRAL